MLQVNKKLIEKSILCNQHCNLFQLEFNEVMKGEKKRLRSPHTWQAPARERIENLQN